MYPLQDHECISGQIEYDNWSNNQPVNQIVQLNAPGVNNIERNFINRANPTKVLDIGTGDGNRLFSFLRDSNVDFVGIEKFERLTAQSEFREFIIIQDLLELDVNDYPEEFQNVDVVTILGGSLNGIFCFENHKRAWEKILSILPVGGRIVFDNFKIDGFENLDFIGTTRLFPQAPPQYFLSEKQLFDIWKGLNISIIDQNDLNHPPIRYYLLEKK